MPHFSKNLDKAAYAGGKKHSADVNKTPAPTDSTCSGKRIHRRMR